MELSLFSSICGCLVGFLAIFLCDKATTDSNTAYPSQVVQNMASNLFHRENSPLLGIHVIVTGSTAGIGKEVTII